MLRTDPVAPVSATRPHRLRFMILAVILLLASALIIVHAFYQHETVHAEKARSTRNALQSAVQELNMQLADLQRGLQIFAQGQAPLIRELALQPLNQPLQNALFDQLKGFYPRATTLTLADSQGIPLLDDYRYELTDWCRLELSRHANGTASPPSDIHVGEGGPHFDVIVPVQLPAQESGYLFAAFSVQGLMRVLSHHGVVDHQLYVLDAEDPGNIILGPPQAQAELALTESLAKQVQSGAVHSLPVHQGQWLVAALPVKGAVLPPTWHTAVWAVVLLLLLGATALWFLRRSDRLIVSQHNAIQRDQDRIRQLQQITSDSQLSFDEKVQKLLRLGRNEYAMQFAVLAKVDNNEYTIVSALCPFGQLKAGMVFHLGNTYCRYTLRAGQPTGVAQTTDITGKKHPCYRDAQMESYIGTAVKVHGQVYGVLNFSSTRAYAGRFDNNDFRFLQLMAQWIGIELERREFEGQLETKNALLQSVSRAQSYFIADTIEPQAIFKQILNDILTLANSEVGFIAEVSPGAGAQGHFKVRALHNRVDDNDVVGAFVQEFIRSQRFRKTQNVFNEVLRNGAPVISNKPLRTEAPSPEAGANEPLLKNFLGAPLYHGRHMVGMFALANSAEGYNESFLYTLAPLATACANLIWAQRNEDKRIEAETALRESEKQLKMALEGVNDGLWDWNVRTGAVYFSPRWQNMLGYEIGDILPRVEAWHDLIHPDDFPRFKKRFDNHLHGFADHYQSEHRVRTKSGEWCWILDRGKIVERDYNGNALRAVGTHTDITERKLAERAVRERETRLAAILDTTVDGIITINAKGVIETLNPAAERIFGYRSRELVGRRISLLLAEEQREAFRDALQASIDAGHAAAGELGVRREMTGRRADGNLFPMQLAVSEMRIGESRYFTSIIRDITEQQHAEQLLQDTMALKQGILDSAKLSIISTDAKGVIQTFNAAAEQMLGYSAKDVVGKATPQLFHDRDEIKQREIKLVSELGYKIQDSLEVFIAKARIGIADEQPWSYIRKDGSRFPALITVTALHSQEDEIVGFVYIGRDITRQQQAEEAMSRFKTTLDMTLDCVFMFHPETLKFFYVNQGATEQVGYSYNELLRMTPADILTEYNSDEFRALLQPMITGHTNTLTFESYHQHHDGQRIPVEIFLQYIYPVDQEPRFVAIVRDITDRRRAAKSLAQAEERSRLLLNSAGEGIYGLDMDGKASFVNPAAARMLGYAPDELIGRFMHELIHHSHADGSHYERDQSPVFKAIHNGDIQRVTDEVLWRRDRSAIPVEYTCTPIRKDGEITGAVVIFNDITERRKIEQMKNDFISTVSHELRTPLTSIRGSLGLLVGGAGGDMSEQARTLVNIANKNSERLLLLINDILDIEKIESGKMEYNYQLLHLRAFLDNALQANQAYGEQFHVQFRVTQCPDKVAIYADEDRLMQVMNNLLSNAAKYSNTGGTVEVSAVRRGHKIRISVIDSGRGIAPGFRKRIFEKFAQADSSDSRAITGTGLGLSISKSIVEQHGGRIDFVSVEHVGTTFYFDLPIWTESANTETPRLLKPAKHRLLICEDDADIAYMLRMHLAQAGFDADIALNVEQAKKLIRRQHYLAVTLDLNLTDGSSSEPYDSEGIRLIKELRKHDANRELPIIVVSSMTDAARARLAGSAFGIIDWIDKPLDEQRLLGAVKHIAEDKNGPPRILHVEDDPMIFEMVKVLLKGQVKLDRASNLAEAHEYLRENVYDLILLDVELSDGSGLDLIEQMDDVEYMPQIVIFSAHEVHSDIARKVKAALVKSQASKNELVNIIMSVIRDKDVPETHSPSE